MHPLQSALVAELIQLERLREAAADRAVVGSRSDERDDPDVAPSFVRRSLGRLRGRARIEVRHHA